MLTTRKFDFNKWLKDQKTPCYWRDIICVKGRECNGCAHQPPDDEKPNGKEAPRLIEWQGSYEDGIFPVCPACGEMPYNLDRCVFCGQRFLRDDRAREWEKPPEIKTMDCFVCKGKGTFQYTRSRSNGHLHGRCTACGASIIE